SSPTPYEALCLGVPFINPILGWDKNDPTNKTRWNSQHDTLKHLDPPYVYNVFKGDKEGFVNAVVEASSHPIESLVLDDMRMGAVEARVAAIMETDWKAEAAELLAERQASGSGKVCRFSCHRDQPELDCACRSFGFGFQELGFTNRQYKCF
ncbi:hypothetical protein B0H14DRAFT_2362018, partial [Mycena olivaceomarginata]